MSLERALVFGGSGFLGSYVVNELNQRGVEVYVADRTAPDTEFIYKQYIACDILNENDISKAFEIAKPTWVLNFAGMANLEQSVEDPVKSVELNILANTRILEACRHHIGLNRYIYASSAYAMSNKGSFYGISKLSSEKIIEEYGKRFSLPYTILRYGSVYSELSKDNNYLYNLVSQACSTGKILHHGDGQEVREYIHAADAAKLTAEVLSNESFKSQVIMLTGIERFKRIEIFQMIQELLNGKVNIELKNDGYDHHYKLSPYSFEATFCKRLVANPFIDMGQGLLECIKDYYRNHPKDGLDSI